MHLILRRVIFAALVLQFTIIMFSCESTKKAQEDTTANVYEENMGLFKKKELLNGIPVILKNIPSEKNIEVRMVFSGGASTCQKNKSGLDDLTFNVCASSEKIQELFGKGLYFPVSACTNDFSFYGMSCSAKDFEKSVEVLAESLLETSHAHEKYLIEESRASDGALDRKENPRYELLSAVSENLFADSPYYNGIYYQASSRISEYDIEKNLGSLLNGARITILAAGNFSLLAEKSERPAKKERTSKKERGSKKDSQQKTEEPEIKDPFDQGAEKAFEKFQELFGGIDYDEFSAPKIPDIPFKGKKTVHVNSEFAANDYHYALALPCPSRGRSDYEAYALCTIALDSVLRRNVVDREKAAAFCRTSVLNGKKSAALVIASGKNDGKDFEKAIFAAIGEFPKEEELSAHLEMYKNIYISKIISSTRNAGATLDQITSGIFYEKDYAAFLRRVEKIRSISAADVVAAYEKYFGLESYFAVKVTK